MNEIEEWLDKQHSHVDREYGLDNVCLDGWFDIEELNKVITIKVLEQLVEREEVNNNNFIHICESSEGQECEYSKAKQDTISYLKSEIAKLSTNIDKE